MIKPSNPLFLIKWEKLIYLWQKLWFKRVKNKGVSNQAKTNKVTQTINQDSIYAKIQVYNRLKPDFSRLKTLLEWILWICPNKQ